jgi:glutamine amidotransferase
MSERVVIVDYQMGNLRSVQKAFGKVGVSADISSDFRHIQQADRLILPGVGAFGDAMRELADRQLVDPIRDFLSSGRPFLGICLGLQLLFDQSEEGTGQTGLGFFAGSVRRFQLPEPLKVPHVGWNTVSSRAPTGLLRGIPDGSYFYFVHSYYVQPRDTQIAVLHTDYGGPFCSMVIDGNVVATQFHPEKSQQLGLQLLRNFCDL